MKNAYEPLPEMSENQEKAGQKIEKKTDKKSERKNAEKPLPKTRENQSKGGLKMRQKGEKKAGKKVESRKQQKPLPKMPKIDPKMWECGKWLETFLNEDLRHENLKKLAEKALHILEIKFDLTDKEPSLLHVAKLESMADPEVPFIDQWEELEGKVETFYSFQQAQAQKIFRERRGEGKEPEYFSTNAIMAALAPIIVTKEAIIGVLKKLPEINKPWDVALPEIIEKEGDLITKACIVDHLIGGSGGIINEYALEGGMIRQVKTFKKFNADPRDIFHWNAVISRMFFTFLELGGKDYFIFCDRCRKFVAVQRKGRKRFCSEMCRVYAHQGKA